MLSVLTLLVFLSPYLNCYTELIDLTPEAITVYRNPEFFKNLNQGKHVSYKEKTSNFPKVGKNTPENYKYPGETKKPNPPPASPGFEVNYDNSPEFHHEPRDIFIDTSYTPKRRKGPYGPIPPGNNNLEGTSPVNEKKPSRKESDEEESKSKSKPYNEKDGFVEKNDSEEGFGEFSSENPKSDEEFRAYHEPVLLARDFHPGFASGTYSQPYAYNRSHPILYEDWKFYNYPKIYSKEFLKSHSSPLYSEEPASNAFEADESPSYYSYEDEPEESTNFFDNSGLKSVEADTKHIYKKLLNPKKFKSLKIHLKPKLKKLKLKLKKGHFHNANWYNEYPFNF